MDRLKINVNTWPLTGTISPKTWHDTSTAGHCTALFSHRHGHQILSCYLVIPTSFTDFIVLLTLLISSKIIFLEDVWPPRRATCEMDCCQADPDPVFRRAARSFIAYLRLSRRYAINDRFQALLFRALDQYNMLPSYAWNAEI
ncbi:hypothetical protein O3G_MSEX000098 [Manduca sexta]|nr:hypothetical protein O3G_MSEX000098 [Manduca sexta]KAG6438622.1 hypothetical protein O3G_MSEX000098 [Manduca sexta]